MSSLSHDPIFDTLGGRGTSDDGAGVGGPSVIEVLCTLLTEVDNPAISDINAELRGFNLENGWRTKALIALCFSKAQIPDRLKDIVIASLIDAVMGDKDRDLKNTAALALKKLDAKEAVKKAFARAAAGSSAKENLRELFVVLVTL